MEKIDKIFEKVHTSYFAFIGLVIFIIGLIPAMLVEPNFSLLVTHVSYLGTPSNDLYIFFNIFWFITGVFMIIFLLGFTRYLQEKGIDIKKTWIAFIFSVLSAAGICGMAIFNSEQAYNIHFVFELIFFFMGILYLFSYAYIEWKSSEFSMIQAVFNIIVAVFFIIYLIILVVNRVQGDILPEAQSLTEWLFLFANLIWFLENGIYVLKK